MPRTAARRDATLPFIVCLAAAAGLSGCGTLGTAVVRRDAGEPVAAEPPRPPPKTILVELVFVRFAEDDEQLRDELWRFVDEQSLGAETTRRLNANGLRAGLVGGGLPAHLATRFVPSVVGTAAAEVPPGGCDAPVVRRLLQLLPTKRSEIVTSPGGRDLTLLERHDDGVVGATYRDATPQLVLEVAAAADGRITLDAVPEVRHGGHEKSWVGEDGMFRLEAGQRRHRLEHLRMRATVPGGGMLLVGGMGDDAATVGDGLFRDRGRNDGRCLRLLVLRPLARGTDPMFDAGADADESDDDLPPLTVR